MKISALFVETNGVYFSIQDIDPWDRKRDARKYNDNNPVIAHPPCHLWGNMAFVNYARWGGDHNKPGNDQGCFEAALKSVNKCGGVIEHPAKTRAFECFKIKKPNKIGWSHFENYWVCEVWQSAYGHRANKATWLYYVGNNPPFELIWERPKGTHQIGFQDQRGKTKNKPTLSKKEANATPLAFRDMLIQLAIHAKK
jgi:hypothetical protein